MADYMTLQLGPLLIALVLSGILCGCALVQTYVYYKLFPKDSWKLRTLVAFEMTFQTIHLALLLLGMWQTVMTDYAQRPQILVVAITAIISTVFGGPIAFCTQAFFVFRLYTFSHKKALPIFCSFLVITQFIFTLMVSISTVVARKLLLQSWHWFIISALFVAVCADTAIAVSMSYYLKANEMGFRRTSRVVDRMVLYIMATGIITSISALASAISFLVAPGVYIWLGSFIVGSGLYTNSLLAALNARAKFSHELQHLWSGEVPSRRLVVLDHQTHGRGQTIVCTAQRETLEADNEECEEFEGVSRPWM
ncbi:hypothetical protein BKA82DRAFT_297984 [Pisolithus tinctorius]|uniref:DUF6534 domain-containing protein n=1 Tax=Pisolithus tinctorius Marx 270 TaxID=870435 RepID=A0A0C3NJ91_PISTI|nr:hypothetical protein BKA82DRAFT_297984 [Pisolithus tinctorius]KIN95735.1 hypothetical protein M404DRAFT_297984 [Pisolithus tinctorius Marx 270]